MPGFFVGRFDSECHGENAVNGGSSFDGPNNLRETARSHRYSLEVFEPFGTKSDGILLFLSKCSRPTPEIDEIVIHNGQDEIYRPGKNRWRPLEFTFYEVLNDSDNGDNWNQTARMMFSYWSQKTINIKNSLIGPASAGQGVVLQTSSGSGFGSGFGSGSSPQDNFNNSNSRYYSDAQLDMLDGSGSPIWIYDLYRCWPTKVEPRDLDYSSSEICQVSVTMRFDKANERRN